MVSFELGKEIEKDVYVLSRAWDKDRTNDCKKQCPVIERFCAKVLVRYPFFQAKAVRLMFLQVQVDEFNDNFT